MPSEATQRPLLLLVEDDTSLRVLLEIALSDEGFDIMVAKNGTDGMVAIDADAVRFSGAVTDIQLGPGPSGWDIGHRARELAPTIPVIYMSGDSAHEWSSRGVPGSIMLQKPFVIAQLITAVTTLMNQAIVQVP